MYFGNGKFQFEVDEAGPVHNQQNLHQSKETQ